MTKVTWCAGVALALLAAPATVARADDEAPLEVSLEPWASYDGVDRPYRYVLTLRPRGDGPLEVVADRRLLSFEVHPVEGRRRRRLRCRHPRAPRRPSDGRVITLGGDGDAVHREWIDLRMYCWGRALDALDAGARLEGRYGFRRRTRRQWVARAPGAAWRDATGGVELAPWTFAAPEAQADATDAPIRVEVSDRSVRRGSALSFRVGVRATEGRPRVYIRPSFFDFVVRGPLGEVECGMPVDGGHPPPDLYRRLGGRVAAREVLDAEQLCPDATFEIAGIYEVVPRVHLEHDGADYELDAVTGDFVGEPGLVRVTDGDRGYVIQVPERAADDEGGA